MTTDRFHVDKTGRISVLLKMLNQDTAGTSDYICREGAVLGLENVRISNSVQHELTAAVLLKKFHEIYRTPSLLTVFQRASQRILARNN